MKQSRNEATFQDRFEQFLITRRKRRTPERRAILAVVEACPSCFTADDVTVRLTATNYRVAPATIYSTLELLCECGIVRRFVLERGVYSYERIDSRASVHHVHLVCEGCGKVKQVRDAELDRSIAARRWTGFSAEDYSLTVTGLCTACQRRQHTGRSLKNRKQSQQ